MGVTQIDNGTSFLYKQGNTWYGRDTRPGASMEVLQWWETDYGIAEWGYTDISGKWWRSATQLPIPPGGKKVDYKSTVAPNDEPYKSPTKTYKTETWNSKDGLQQYNKTTKGNWQGIDWDETHPEANLEQSWNTKKSEWQTNGNRSEYQMAPPPGFKAKDPSITKPPTPPPLPPLPKPPKAGTVTTYSGPTKSSKVAVPSVKEIPSQYDLLFNSLNYMSVGEAEIEKLSMDLIFAGDDLLTDFDYRSIDYLPDFEIETTNKYGDFVDVRSVYSNPAEPLPPKPPPAATSNLAEPKDLNKTIDALITEMQKNLENQSFAKVSKYFGVNNTKTGFNTGYSKGDKIDFRYTLTEQFWHYDITIDFNLI